MEGNLFNWNGELNWKLELKQYFGLVCRTSEVLIWPPAGHPDEGRSGNMVAHLIIIINLISLFQFRYLLFLSLLSFLLYFLPPTFLLISFSVSLSKYNIYQCMYTFNLRRFQQSSRISSSLNLSILEALETQIISWNQEPSKIHAISLHWIDRNQQFDFNQLLHLCFIYRAFIKYCIFSERKRDIRRLVHPPADFSVNSGRRSYSLL